MGPAGSTGYSVMLIVSLDRISVRAAYSLQHRAAEPHIRSPLRAADTKIPRTRGHRAREDGANLYGGILQPGRYAAHPPRSDEEFPRGCCDVVRIAPALCSLQHGALRPR